MAFETVTGNSLKTLSKLAVGESVVGYLKNVMIEDNKFNNKSFNLIMVDPTTGSEFKVLTGGTAKYVGQNIAMGLGLFPKDPTKEEYIKRDLLMVNHLVKITKGEPYTNKTKQVVASYSFARDPEKKLSDLKVSGTTVKSSSEIDDLTSNIPF